MKKFITFLLIGTLAVTGIPLSALAEENEAEVSVEIPSSVSHEGETQETGETEEKTEVTAEDEEIVEKPEAPAEDEEIVEKPEAPAEDEEIVEKPDVSTEDEEIVEEPEASVKEVKVLKKPELTYQAHVQNEGWQNWKKETELSGTQGKALRMEAIRVKLTEGESSLSGSIEYRAHVQDYGWQNWVKDGQLSGTQGQSKRLEAIQIRLTGPLAEQYDVYYRVHIQNAGWLDWVKNGESAGSSGLSLRMESFQVMLVKKGETTPSNGKRGFLKGFENNDLTYRGHIQNIGNTSLALNGQTLGTVGKKLRMEGVTIQINMSDPLTLDGGIEYAAHVQNEGWQGYRKSGQLAGTTGKALRMEALKIRLTGEMAKYYNIYYRTHVQEFGWLGWAKNGEPSGSEGYAYRLEAVQILIKPNILPAPGNTSHAFVKKEKPASRSFSAVLGFDGEKIVRELSAHEKDSYYLGTSYQPLRNPSNLNELMYPKGDRRGDGYSGMNCTGFVAYVVRKCGGNLTPIGQMGLRGGFCNASNWYRYFKTKKVEYYTYSSVSELLKSGKAEKGDIIYCEPKNWNQWGADCHIGFFWGNRSNENKFWHSSTKPGKGNQISAITPVTDPSYICLIKMV